MFGMFGFLNDANNYEERKVDRNDYDWGFISTARCSDGMKPYETAVQHDAYGESMVIVEGYDTKEEAKEGHAKWVKRMTAKKLPKKLVDCCNAEVAQLCKALGGDLDKSLKA